MMTAPYSPLAVANEFIRRAERGSVDHMKLQKLVYYAHGIGLVRHITLVNEQPQVWKLGPVFPSLYFELKYHGSDPINTPEAESVSGRPPRVDENDGDSHQIIEDVWQRFCKYTAVQLSNLTHKAGTPWFTTAARCNWRVPRDTEISRETMGRYFSLHGLNG